MLLSHRGVVIPICAQALAQATLSSIQSIFDQRFNQGAAFPGWLAPIAMAVGATSLLNAWIVNLFGMRRGGFCLLQRAGDADGPTLGLGTYHLLGQIAGYGKCPLDPVGFGLHLADQNDLVA